jgi:hypothetical protein
MADPKRPGGGSRERATTRRGYGSSAGSDFDDDAPTIVEPRELQQLREDFTGLPPRGRGESKPAIEIQLVEENGAGSSRRPWRAIEIWTKNRIYSVDSRMYCVEVLDRESGRADPNHSFVGARLGGGQRREGSSLRLSHPFPIPGTEAVFKLPNGRQGRFGQTSKVERVVLRLRVANVSLLEAEPAWEEITGKVSIPPPAGNPRGGR